MNKTILFAKTKDGAVIPSKRIEDAGYDLYACFDEDYIVIKPHETKMISTGICSAFSSDYVAILKERGSTGTKGIGQRCGVIDSGFRNTWMIPITNHNDVNLIIRKKDYIISNDDVFGLPYVEYPYEKAICQTIMVEVPKLEIKEVTVEEIMKIESERGLGMLGSSSK